MQARRDWVLIIFGTQVIKKKRPVRPVFPDYFSVSYDYGNNDIHGLRKFYDDIESNIRSLLSLRIEIRTHDTLIATLVLEKIPKKMLKRLGTCS